MDSFVDDFQAAVGSLVSVAKDNRSREVRKACKKHGRFYLASVGGGRHPALRIPPLVAPHGAHRAGKRKVPNRERLDE